MKARFSSFYYRVRYFVDFRLYAPVHDLYWRIYYARHPRDIGRAPCQICGEQGHIEQYCPKAKEMGF